MLADGARDALARGTHGDPFGALGPHRDGDGVEIRAMLPQASRVAAIDAQGRELCELRRTHGDGVFEGRIEASAVPAYRLRMTIGDWTTTFDDPYRFGPVLGELDVYLIAEGRHLELYRKYGAHVGEREGVNGVSFVVWAPNVARASVVGDFNDWDGRRHPMRLRSEIGAWEIFIPGLGVGARYKFEFLARDGSLLPLRADPYGFAAEKPPATASVVAVPGAIAWTDAAWLAERGARQERTAAISIYEVHAGSWKRLDDNRYLTYREMADDLVNYAKFMGFTHIELMPISEHPFDGSWGYQPVGLFAPTSRFGSPDDFAYFVDAAHTAGIGVLLDWVPGHFPTDAHGLGTFDGTHLYEHADPRQGYHPDWNTLIYNFERTEVANFLISNALFWADLYHIDGLRVDAVASMLYLDFSRREGEWIPNRFGGRENLGAIDFLKHTNEALYGAFPTAMTVAEESTSWPRVSAPTWLGGLGFGYKWDLGWMHDTLDYLSLDPVYRKWSQDRLTFSFMYAFDENFVLPLSHDEVVHGKGSLLQKMSGDRWQKFANLRALYGFMYAHPGKKLLFMGDEFAQDREWNHDRSLDWHLTNDASHAGVQRLVRDLNHTYRALPPLYELDATGDGVEWIVSDGEQSVTAFVRRARDSSDFVVAVANLTPVPRHGYRIGVPGPGRYVEAINTDGTQYGGGGLGNGPIEAQPYGAHDKPYSIELTLPPLATLILKRAS